MSLCPSCPTAEMVQSIVFDDSFWRNVLFVSLPLVLLALLAAVLYGMTLRGRERVHAA